MSTKYGVSLPIYNTSLPELTELTTYADEGGFDSVWSYEVFSNPFNILTAAAGATKTIGLGTGLAQATTRSPFLMANEAAHIDEYSGGRTILGIGAGDPLLTAASGVNITKPLAYMREYIGQLRTIWKMMATGDGGDYHGRFNHGTVIPESIGPRRNMVRDNIPIYVGAIRPKMIEAAAESADGLLGCFYTPSYHDEVVLPSVAKGVEKTGRKVEDIDTIMFLICSISDDREEAYRWARIHVGAYVALPGFVDSVLEHHGFQEQQNILRMAMLTEGGHAVEKYVSDDLVELLSVAGTPDEVRDKTAPLAQRFPHLLLHTPAVPPITAAESRAAYQAIVDTFGR